MDKEVPASDIEALKKMLLEAGIFFTGSFKAADFEELGDYQGLDIFLTPGAYMLLPLEAKKIIEKYGRFEN